ncbi:MAG TPA: hypothetical protein VMG12_40185 [Polyangiaceae bacterium]|nr:hypothetical protein [Polyangiaceae bacterium]
MPSVFRPSTPSDGPELTRMAERLLGVAPESPMFGDAQLSWKYWAPWRSGTSPRSYVLVRDGRIVAHVAALSLECRRGARTLTLLHPFDWMSEPSAIGAGAAVLQRLTKLGDGVLIVGGSQTTQRMVRPLGFRALGDVGCYAARVGTSAAPASDATSLGAELTLSVVTEPTAEVCASVEPPIPWLEALRSPERLADFLRCPVAAMSVHAVRRDGALLGGFLLAKVPGQARIAAFWAARDAHDLPALLGASRRHAASHAGVSEVVSMANLPAERAALEAAGFRQTGSVPSFLLTRATELDADTAFAFQMIDGDVAFLHHGAPQPWL